MNKKIELGHVLTDQEKAQVVASQMKQQKDSLADFQKGGRDDLVAQTQAQMKVLQQYLPQQLSKAELQQIVQQSAAEIQATSEADFGKLMKTVMPKVRGRADGSLVNQIVKAFLQ